MPQEREVSIKKPTILGWLLQRDDCPYEDCLERLHDAPEEGSTWLVDENKQTRHLPLHWAVRRLHNSNNNNSSNNKESAEQRQVLCDLISHLLLVHPDGARQMFQGRLPIHDAVAGGVDEETLALFLTVYPESIFLKDENCQTLTEINQQCNQHHTAAELQTVLDLGFEEWKSAYEASPLGAGVSLSRMDDLMSLASRTTKETSTVAGGHASTTTKEVAAAVVVAVPAQDDSSISSTEEGEAADDDMNTDIDNENDAPAVSWEQVQDQAVALEKMLTDMKSVNRQLHNKITILQTDGLVIIQQVDRHQGTDLYHMVEQLEQHNTRLEQQIQQTEDLLHDTVFPAYDMNEESKETLQRRGRVARMLGWLNDNNNNDDDDDNNNNNADDKENDTLKQIYNELKASYEQQRVGVEEFQFVFDKVVDKKRHDNKKGDDDDDDDEKSADATRSLVSNITMNEEDWSLHSEDFARPERSQRVEMELEFNFPKKKKKKPDMPDPVSDNLSTIFRMAIDDKDKSPGGAKQQEEELDMALDTLSQMLQAAADREHHANKLLHGSNNPSSSVQKTPESLSSSQNVPGSATSSKKKKKYVGSVSSSQRTASSSRNAVPPPPPARQASREIILDGSMPNSPAATKQSGSTLSKPSFFDSSRIYAVPSPPSSDRKIDPSLPGEEKVEEEYEFPTHDTERTHMDSNHLRTTDKCKPREEKQVAFVESDVAAAETCPLLDKYMDKVTLVSFSTVSIRHFDRIICDNPASSNGPSIGIGWDYEVQPAQPVNDYEGKRYRKRRQAADELLLSREQREDILLDVGYSQQDIVANVRLLNKCRSQRRQTIVNLGAAKLEETVEAAKRKVKSLLFLKKRSSLSSSRTTKSSSLSISSASSSSTTRETTTPSSPMSHQRKRSEERPAFEKESSRRPAGKINKQNQRWPSFRRLAVTRVEV